MTVDWTCCTKCWSNLTSKCNANTFVKVDAQIEEECQRTISYLQEYSYPKFYCNKLSNQKPTANTVRNTSRTTLRWMRDKNFHLSNLLCIYPAPLFSKPVLTKQKVVGLKEKSVVGFRSYWHLLLKCGFQHMLISLTLLFLQKKIDNIFLKIHHSLLRMPKIIEIA